MKIDDREDALMVARHLAATDVDIEGMADALLQAHLEGIEQARSQFSQG